MNALMFVAKRVHLRTVAFGQGLVKAVKGMTPARFDLLYVLYRSRFSDGVIGVRAPLEVARTIGGLARELGLHRTTISKMVRRLVEMGWLVRRRYARDRRAVVVGFTEVGLRCLMRAEGIAGGKMMDASVGAMADEATMGHGAAEVLVASVAVWWRVARHFWNTSAFVYPLSR